MSLRLGYMIEMPLFWVFFGGNTFQNLSVSSPAPVTRVWPSGLAARYKTRYEWPVRVAMRFMLGYFQTLMAF